MLNKQTKINFIQEDVFYISSWMSSIWDVYYKNDLSIRIEEESLNLKKILYYLDEFSSDQFDSELIDKFKFFVLSYSISFKNQKFSEDDMEFPLLKASLIERLNELLCILQN